jgi:3-oxoacyl-[acyl-carrier protein] reductase
MREQAGAWGFGCNAVRIRQGKDSQGWNGCVAGCRSLQSRTLLECVSDLGYKRLTVGAVHALREELRTQQIGVTVINPGNVGTPEVLADLAAGELVGGQAIPLSDLLKIIDCILSLSRATCVKEIDVPSMLGEGA